MTVILPQQTSGQIGMRGTAPDADPPVLYLLHGLSDDDLLWLVRQTGLTAATCPQLYLCCGTDDALFADNLQFRDVAVERGLPLTVDFGPGEHEWGYWDAKIQDVLSWLPLGGKHRQER
jgi:S-formylglutathione hydrolase FrmB